MNYTEFRERYHWNAKIDKLGQGGFGKVYRAIDTLRDRSVVLKISDVPTDHKFSLQREVELNRDLSAHPNIAQYRNCYRLADEYGEEKDYATMDYFGEGSLATVLKKHVLTDADKHAIILGILRGLAHLEGEQLVHRDFKPGNVLMVRDAGLWIPKIADFGLSRFNGSDASATNSSVGISYDYAAPEQFRAGTINQQADLWAAGVIFYQLLTGDLPFAAQPDLTGESRRLELIRQIEQAQLPDHLSQIAEPYQTLIRRCLVKDPQERVKSAHELLTLLDKLQAVPVLVSLPEPQVEVIIESIPGSIQPLAKAAFVEPPPIPPSAPVPVGPPRLPAVVNGVNGPDRLEGANRSDQAIPLSRTSNGYLVPALFISALCFIGSCFAWYGHQPEQTPKAAYLSVPVSNTIPTIPEKDLPERPDPPRLVNDFVDRLLPVEQRQLESKLVNYSSAGTVQIAVVIVKTTAPYSIKDFAVSTGRKWGVGQSDKNNGIVIAWATEERKVFIATGSGLEPALPDSSVKQIITDVIAPAFRQEQWYLGLDQATTAIHQRLDEK